jgi:hypothetical protein
MRNVIDRAAVERVEMSNVSDVVWGISRPNLDSLIQGVEDALKNVSLFVVYGIKRQNDETSSPTTNAFPVFLNESHRTNMSDGLRGCSNCMQDPTQNCSNITLVIDKFYYSVLAAGIQLTHA